jgi:TIR domain
MPKVFVSYSSGDSAFAKMAAKQLQERGIDVWLDRGSLHPGDDWRKGIDDGISSTDVLIVVLSPRSSKSPYVTYEWASALGKRRRVIPVLIESTELHPRLEALQWLDFTDPEKRPWQSLLDAIARKDEDGFGIFSSGFPDSYQSDLERAGEVWLLGVSLQNTAPRLCRKLIGDLERKGNRAKVPKLRVLLAKPVRSVVTTAVLRRHELAGNDLKRAVKTKIGHIEGTRAELRSLEAMLPEEKKNLVEVRTTTYTLGYGIHGMNLVKGPDPVLYVKLYPFRVNEEQHKPQFILRKGYDRWYTSFSEEVLALWRDGLAYP